MPSVTVLCEFKMIGRFVKVTHELWSVRFVVACKAKSWAQSGYDSKMSLTLGWTNRAGSVSPGYDGAVGFERQVLRASCGEADYASQSGGHRALTAAIAIHSA